MLGIGLAIFLFGVAMWIQDGIEKAHMRKGIKLMQQQINQYWSSK
jgi:hypothetical protein